MMYKFARATTAIAASLLLIGATPAREPEIYILAGQSNMSGRGAVDALAPAEREIDPRITLLGNDGMIRPAAEPLDDATGQIDLVSEDRHAGVGPGLFFARALVAKRGRPILLIPCAKGGSSIRRWGSGRRAESLYGSCLARARSADGHVAGILWYQGESDTETPDRAREWSGRFSRLVTDFRRDLGDARLPVVYVQIAARPARPDRASRYPAWAIVQAAQANLRLDCARMVKAEGLPANADQLHLSTEGQRALGARLAGAMDALLQGECG